MIELGGRTPITAIALDTSVDLPAAAARLKWPEVRRYAYGSLYDIDNGGALYVFRFGAIVQMGVSVLDPGLRSVIESATGARSIPETEETYWITVDPERSQGSPRVGWDQVAVPDSSPELLGAVMLLLGQSAALERYEKGAQQLLGDVMEISRHLSVTGSPARSSRQQIRRIGRLTSDRLELASLFFLLDRPEATWENSNIASLYDALFKNLELHERHQTVLEKLRTVQEVTGIVVDMWQGVVSQRLEWAIVLLIVFEIVITLVEKLT